MIRSSSKPNSRPFPKELLSSTMMAGMSSSSSENMANDSNNNPDRTFLDDKKNKNTSNKSHKHKISQFLGLSTSTSDDNSSIVDDNKNNDNGTTMMSFYHQDSFSPEMCSPTMTNVEKKQSEKKQKKLKNEQQQQQKDHELDMSNEIDIAEDIRYTETKVEEHEAKETIKRNEFDRAEEIKDAEIKLEKDGEKETIQRTNHDKDMEETHLKKEDKSNTSDKIDSSPAMIIPSISTNNIEKIKMIKKEHDEQSSLPSKENEDQIIVIENKLSELHNIINQLESSSLANNSNDNIHKTIVDDLIEDCRDDTPTSSREEETSYRHNHQQQNNNNNNLIVMAKEQVTDIQQLFSSLKQNINVKVCANDTIRHNNDVIVTENNDNDRKEVVKTESNYGTTNPTIAVTTTTTATTTASTPTIFVSSPRISNHYHSNKIDDAISPTFAKMQHFKDDSINVNAANEENFMESLDTTNESLASIIARLHRSKIR